MFTLYAIFKKINLILAELKESWTKFVDKVKQHTEMAGQPIADQFVRLIGPLVNAYATKNVNGIMDVFKQYEQQAPGLLPHITNIKVRGAAAKAMSDFQKFREKNPKPTQAQIDEHIRKEHALVEQALKMKTG